MSRIETGQGTAGFAECGDGGVPLVFLHGVGSTRAAWAPQLAHFGTKRRTIAIDFPGYGESDRLPPGEGAMHDRFARFVIAVLDALDVAQCHLCGLSLGGVVAIAVSALAPERLASLIIADSFAVHPDGRAILDRSVAASGDMRSMASVRVPVLLADSGAEVAGAMIADMATIDPGAFRDAAEAVWIADQRGRLGAINLPALILCGADDRVTPPALSLELAERIAGARLVSIADAGHLPNLEQPGAFDAAVETFLRPLA